MADWTIPQSRSCCKVTWMPDGDLFVLSNDGVRKMNFDSVSGMCNPVLIHKVSDATDMYMAADGTWILALESNGFDICETGTGSVKRETMKGKVKPFRVAMNKTNIFACAKDVHTIYSYKRNLLLENVYKLGAHGNGFIDVTEGGSLVVSSPSAHQVLLFDMATKRTTMFDSASKEDGEVSAPWGFCSVRGDYFLVSDRGNDCVSVFTHDGKFLHHLDVEDGVRQPFTIAALERKDQPTLLAIGMDSDTDDRVLCVYTLE